MITFSSLQTLPAFSSARPQPRPQFGLNWPWESANTDTVVLTEPPLPPKQQDKLSRTVPVRDLVRCVPSDAPLTLPAAYWQNQAEVRQAFIKALNSHQLDSRKDFAETLRALHVLASVGSTGKSTYYKRSGKLLSPEELTPGKFRPCVKNHPFINARYREEAKAIGELAQLLDDPFSPAGDTRYRQKFKRHEKQFIHLPGVPENELPFNVATLHAYPRSDLMGRYFNYMYPRMQDYLALPRRAGPSDVASTVGTFYHIAANARPFYWVNNSLFMNMTNTMLERFGLNGVPHGLLDHAAQRLQPQNFARLFRMAVQLANPQKQCLREEDLAQFDELKAAMKEKDSLAWVMGYAEQPRASEENPFKVA